MIIEDKMLIRRLKYLVQLGILYLIKADCCAMNTCLRRMGIPFPVLITLLYWENTQLACNDVAVIPVH
ncbi:hypothetical protein BG74_04670 [Sodalis-like endosymbiont of Proechinophthirus fluctus]|nr:hypothetical protein BG74_04670 [Sodalis-like endosymbiont of Proechinophthirus fluctus]